MAATVMNLTFPSYKRLQPRPWLNATAGVPKTPVNGSPLHVSVRSRRGGPDAGGRPERVGRLRLRERHPVGGWEADGGARDALYAERRAGAARPAPAEAEQEAVGRGAATLPRHGAARLLRTRHAGRGHVRGPHPPERLPEGRRQLVGGREPRLGLPPALGAAGDHRDVDGQRRP